MTPPASITEDPALQVDPDYDTDLFDEAECAPAWEEEVSDDNEFDIFVQLLAKEIGAYGFTNRAFQLIDKVAANGDFADIKRLFQTQLRTENAILPPGLLRDCSQEIYIFFEDETGQQISQLHIPAQAVPRDQSSRLILNSIQSARHLDKNYQEFLATYLMHGGSLEEIRHYLSRVFGTTHPQMHLLTWFTRPLAIRHYDNCGLQLVVTIGSNLAATGVEITPFKLRAS